MGTNFQEYVHNFWVFLFLPFYSLGRNCASLLLLCHSKHTIALCALGVLFGFKAFLWLVTGYNQFNKCCLRVNLLTLKQWLRSGQIPCSSLLTLFTHLVNVYVYIMSLMLHWELVAPWLRESKIFSSYPTGERCKVTNKQGASRVENFKDRKGTEKLRDNVPGLGSREGFF